METFEEQFKTRAQGNSADLAKVKKKVAQKAPTKTSLIDANKAKNLAITLRKGGMDPSAICTAIETYVLLLITVYHSQNKSLLVPFTALFDASPSIVQVRPAVSVHRLPGITRTLHPIRL